MFPAKGIGAWGFGLVWDFGVGRGGYCYIGKLVEGLGQVQAAAPTICGVNILTLLVLLVRKSQSYTLLWMK